MKPTISQLKNTPLQFDDRDSVSRVGMIVLATDLTSEHDFIQMCAHPRIQLHVTRTTYENPVTPENLKAMESGLVHSVSLSRSGPGPCGCLFQLYFRRSTSGRQTGCRTNPVGKGSGSGHNTTFGRMRSIEIFECQKIEHSHSLYQGCFAPGWRLLRPRWIQHL